MKIGTVTGAVWSSRKASCLMGQTFLVVSTAEGEVVAADQVGAGSGDRVLLVTGTVQVQRVLSLTGLVVPVLARRGT